jgi:hypothetical protein
MSLPTYMNIPILLSKLGQFSLIPSILNNANSRYDSKLISLYHSYGNKIANNCSLYIDSIPENIFNQKLWSINSDHSGREYLIFYEYDGDIIMRK